MIELSQLSIEKAHKHLVEKDFSVLDLVKAYKSEIEKEDQKLHAYLEVFGDLDSQAIGAQKKIDDDTAHLLTGIPFAIKDNILIKGRKVSAASKILENYQATYDSTVSLKLKSLNSIFLGRTNMDEFAMGGSTENSAFGPTRNPFDTDRVPGGSSGGSAVSVAANLALVSLGSDTGGSIRQPASFCGCVGLKPTYGRVSRFGLMAMGSSLDQIGPLAKTVRDTEIVFEAIKGKDPLDSTTSEPEEKHVSGNMKVGIPKGLLEMEGLEKEVSQNFKESIKKLESLGFEIKEVDLPNLFYALAVYYVIMPAEVSSNMARFDGMKFGSLTEGKNLIEDYLNTRGDLLGKEVRRRIILGTYVLSSGYYDAYYNKANSIRNIILNDFKKAFTEVDSVAMPTSPVLPFKIGGKINDPLSMYLSDIFTVTANIVGIPAISVPSGFADRDGKKLPIGIQFMANAFEEDKLFYLGKKFLGEN